MKKEQRDKPSFMELLTSKRSKMLPQQFTDARRNLSGTVMSHEPLEVTADDGSVHFMVEFWWRLGAGRWQFGRRLSSSREGAEQVAEELRSEFDVNSAAEDDANVGWYLADFEEYVRTEKDPSGTFLDVSFPDFERDCLAILRQARLVNAKSRTVKHWVLSSQPGMTKHYREHAGSAWQFAALNCFAVTKYGPNSLIGYAARILYLHETGENQLAMGYLVRELELLLSGAEESVLRREAISRQQGENARKTKNRKYEDKISDVWNEVKNRKQQKPNSPAIELIKWACRKVHRENPTQTQLENTCTYLVSHQPYQEEYKRIFNTLTY